MWIVLLGAPGCGKGTQSEKLIADHGFISISTGDLLRQNKDRVIDGGKTIGDVISSGSLLLDSVTIGLIKEQLLELGADNVIFDGFPRTIIQAEALDKMAFACGKKIDKVINFVIDDEVVVKRITGRFKCSKCGKIYNKFFLQTKIPEVCDECKNTKFEYRLDDNRESLTKRLSEYHEKTYPLIDFYSKSGILYDVEADASFDDVTEFIIKILNDSLVIKKENK